MIAILMAAMTGCAAHLTWPVSCENGTYFNSPNPLGPIIEGPCLTPEHVCDTEPTVTPCPNLGSVCHLAPATRWAMRLTDGGCDKTLCFSHGAYTNHGFDTKSDCEKEARDLAQITGIIKPEIVCTPEGSQ